MKKQSRQIQTRDVEGPFDHIRTFICSPLKITFSVGTWQYKVAKCPLYLNQRFDVSDVPECTVLAVHHNDQKSSEIF